MVGKNTIVYLQYSVVVGISRVRTVLQEVSGKEHLSVWAGKVFKEVEENNNNLILNRDRVRAKVEATDDKTEMVNNDVFKWLKEADILIQEVETLIQEVKNLKIQSGVPSWNRFSKLVEKITALNVNCEFHPFSTQIPSLERFSSEYFVCFNSIKETSDQLLEALRDDNNNYYMIGLYGKQGSGKTTLVKAIGEKVKHLNYFCEILFVTVTENPNIRRMQAEIADSLNMRLDISSEEAGRATRILSTIQNRRSHPILVIFDDVRAKFNPKDVGIPLNSNRCKVILITCCQQDCEYMGCQREIKLDPLSTDDTWTLFKSYSGIHHEENLSSFDLLNVAREVAAKCEGLPGKIKNVGYSLRSKPIEEWKASLESLKHSINRCQIFLSFRGEDTRFAFTGHLFHALRQVGFTTFIDDVEMHTGDQISLTLLNAVEAASLSIVVLSENYASSTWCLDELVKIIECKNLKNQLVWPIFYEVDPSDIRHMRNSYGKYMTEHEQKFGSDSERLQKWRSALYQVSNLSGKTYTSGYEYEFIQKIVDHAKSHLEIQNM